jgi:hypothetical protein
MTFLPKGFEHPLYVAVDDKYHLRPIREADTELDYPAVMGSRARLWSMFGDAWGWPPETMTIEQDQADLRRHHEEMATNSSFNYALFDEGETALLGCVYIDPPEDDMVLPTDTDAVISWWTVDALVGTPAANALDATVPVWIAAEWPFHHPHFGLP